MRICFLAPAKSVHSRNWVLSFLERNHEVHVITFHNAEIENVKVHFIHHPISMFKVNYLLSVSRVKRILSQIRPDVVVGYYLTSYGLISSISGFQPLVLAAAGSDIYGNDPPTVFDRVFLHRIFTRNVLRRASLILSWAEHMKRRLIELGAEEEKIVTFPRGIDTRIFHPAPQDNHSPRKEIRIIATRNLQKFYQHSLLLKAVELTKRQGIGVECIILGEGPEKDNLQRQAADLRIAPQVKFGGAANNIKVAACLREADIYVSITRTDGASASLFEAMASGVFPIVSDIPANREWIRDGVNGYLVPLNSPEILSDRIIKAARNFSLRASAREENPGIIRDKASLEVNLKRMEEYFLRLTGKN